ncbi:MAG: hypothetical protein AAB354_09300 [candidate division KSB1 bacterium]
MQGYTLPRETFNLLLEVFGEQQKAEKFAQAMESAIAAIDHKATERIVDKKEMIKIEVREELRKELVTREIFESFSIEVRERFNVVDEKFKSLNLRLNIFLAIALIALTFANPAFVVLLQKLF